MGCTKCVCCIFLLIQMLSHVYVWDVTARVRSNKDLVQVAVVAKLNSVLAAVCSADRLLADVQISGLLLFAIAFYSFKQYIRGSFLIQILACEKLRKFISHNVFSLPF